MWSDVWSDIVSDLLIRDASEEVQSLQPPWLSFIDAGLKSGSKEPSRLRRRQTVGSSPREKAPQLQLLQQQQEGKDEQALDRRTSTCSSKSAIVDFPPASKALPLRSGLTAEEVEPWQRFPHLLTGYRRHGTHLQCIASMFSPHLHNETLNAWTMVFSMLAAALLLGTCLPQGPASTWADSSPFWVLFLAQLIHCPVSVGYHTFMPISAATAHRWRRTDLCLVLLLNAASTYSLAYFTLSRCMTLALTAAACACAGSGMYSILSLKQGQSLDRVKMVGQVAGTAAGYYVVVIYRGVAAATAAWSAARRGGADAGSNCSAAAALWACLCCPELATAWGMLLCHGAGATCYVSHWPQRQFPRVFDLCGFSHNLMHVFCLAIYVWGYPYLSILHSKQGEWFAPS